MSHAYVRLEVEIGSKKNSARQVQGQLVYCRPQIKVGGVANVVLEDALMTLPWSFDKKELVDIPSGSARYLDILQVRLDDEQTAR